MMKYFLIFTALLIGQVSGADCHKKLKVAIIDTGLNLEDPRFKGLICPAGSRNFALNESMNDINGHGTHVAGLIKTYAGFGNYCLLIYKYYSDKNTGVQNLKNEVNSIKEAIEFGATIINISGGGPERKDEEERLIQDHPEITFMVAAGNEGKDLDNPENGFYPASYNLPNIVVVGSRDQEGNRAPTSNFGSIVRNWEDGQGVLSYAIGGDFTRMSGTSQATGIHTGKEVEKQTATCHIH